MMRLGEFLTFVVAKGISSGAIKHVPTSIILVGHYNRADLTMFEERKDVLKRLKNIRKSFIAGRSPLKFRYEFSKEENDFIELNVSVQDTILLAPAGKKSLAQIGTLVGCAKKTLSDDPEIERNLKKNMACVLENDWELFKEYAIADAEICVRYYKKINQLYRSLIEDHVAPATLSSIAVNMLLSEWENSSANINEMVGKEVVKDKVFNKKYWQYKTKKSTVYLEQTSWFVDFTTECYHGGRNEQMWFGASREDSWTDYDLTSAYPTAMATIHLPDWQAIWPTTKIEDLLSTQMTFACVDFVFADNVRYPALPVRSENGIIFPLSGRSYCASPEIKLAIELGCKITVVFGLVIPQKSEQLVFFDFIKKTIGKRAEANTDIEKAFWKELTNSAYGKTAQGLRNKRVYNLYEEDMEDVSESKITNPYFAAYITSFVRALVGEIINGIPQDKMIFSVTTDGFITNSTDQEIAKASQGPIASMFRDARRQLAGSDEILSEKHSVRQVLGWKTRGQATLKRRPSDGDFDYAPVLAKGGIKPPFYEETVEQQNDYIVDRFLNRKAGEKFPLTTFTTVREMIVSDADLVSKIAHRATNMEYDFKRQPTALEMTKTEFRGKQFEHLAFATKPWETADQFKKVREMWDNYYLRTNRKPLKSIKNYETFARIAEERSQLTGRRGKYLSQKSNRSLRRLQRDICRAFKHGRAGFAEYGHLTATDLASYLNESGLTEHGVKTTRATVENGSKELFEPNSTPRTPEVLEIVENLEALFPAIDWKLLLAEPTISLIEPA
jgi:DNA polymerase type B, organellar and viral